MCRIRASSHKLHLRASWWLWLITSRRSGACTRWLKICLSSRIMYSGNTMKTVIIRLICWIIRLRWLDKITTQNSHKYPACTSPSTTMSRVCSKCRRGRRPSRPVVKSELPNPKSRSKASAKCNKMARAARWTFMECGMTSIGGVRSVFRITNWSTRWRLTKVRQEVATIRAAFLWKLMLRSSICNNSHYIILRAQTAKIHDHKRATIQKALRRGANMLTYSNTLSSGSRTMSRSGSGVCKRGRRWTISINKMHF